MSIPYYWVNPKNNRAYWRPNRRMAKLGFGCVSLGLAGEQAEQEARCWNARWQQVRGNEDIEAVGLRQDSGSNRGYIYFLQVSDRIKIGVSRKPLGRLQELAGAAPGAFQRVVVVQGTRNDERLLHRRFSSYRTGGEWFVASRPVLLSMARCAAAGAVVHDGARTQGVRGVEAQAIAESNRTTGEKANA